jgi:GH24 family phage-related lysozyme (muramidase)
MAGAGEVLKQFVVAIGFRVDESSLSRVESSIGGLAGTLAKLGVALVGATVALEKQVDKVQSSFEKLRYAAGRSGTTINKLKEVGYGGAQAGIGSEEDVQSSIQAMAMEFFRNPATKVAMGGLLGVQVQGRDTADIWIDMLEKLEKMGQQGLGYQATAYGQWGGIPQEMIMATPEQIANLRKFAEEKKQMDAKAGYDADKMAKEDFIPAKQSRRRLESEVQVGLDKAASDLAPKLGTLNDKLGDVITSVDKLSAATLGLGQIMLTVGGSLGVVGFLSKIFGGGAGVAGLGLTGLAAGAAGLGLAGLALGPDAWVEALDKSIGLKDPKSWPAWWTNMFGGGKGDVAGEDITRQFEGNIPNVYTDQLTGAQTYGIGHKVKPGEKFTGDSAEREKVFQQDWMNARRLVLDKLKGKDFNDKIVGGLTDLMFQTGGFGGDLNAAIKAGNWEKVADLMPQYNGYHDKNGQFLRSDTITKRRLADAKMIREGAKDLGATLQQQTTINVNGTGDPKQVADKVARQQTQVTQTAMHNLAQRTH